MREVKAGQPATLDYAKPQPQPASGVGRIIGGFLAGWFLGIIATGMLADIITPAITGYHHDGGMYVVAAFAIVIAAPILAMLRAGLGRRVNGLFAFLFGLAGGPLILGAMIAMSYAAK